MFSTIVAGIIVTSGLIFGAPHQAPVVGDDNHDGMVMEDESGWSCATMGNLVCGAGAVELPSCPELSTWGREGRTE